MQVYDTAHLLFQACVIKLVVKIQVRALLPCCGKTAKADDSATPSITVPQLPLYAVTTPQGG